MVGARIFSRPGATSEQGARIDLDQIAYVVSDYRQFMQGFTAEHVADVSFIRLENRRSGCDRHHLGHLAHAESTIDAEDRIDVENVIRAFEFLEPFSLNRNGIGAGNEAGRQIETAGCRGNVRGNTGAVV